MKDIENPWPQLVGQPPRHCFHDDFDIYKVADEMKHRMDGHPTNAKATMLSHLCHKQDIDSVDKYLADLRSSAEGRDTPAQVKDGLAESYGQAAIVPDRSVVGNILKGYLDVLYTPAATIRMPNDCEGLHGNASRNGILGLTRLLNNLLHNKL